ncbi:MAG: hypothetical protein LBN07_04135 [Christensenellaceae bacterium]|jgi:hypothetical protein|nr:hypothetical protein [Christensenellaceae bacterium]
MKGNKQRLAKMLNKFVICILIGVMFIFAGCESGGGTNSIGNNNNNDDPTPPSGPRPPAVVEIDPDPNDSRGFGSNYQDMDEYMDGIRMILKKDARTVEDMAYIKEKLTEDIDALAEEILKGLVAEYGPSVKELSQGAIDNLEILGWRYTNTNPFVSMNYAGLGFTLGGMAATQSEIQQYDSEMLAINPTTIVHMQEAGVDYYIMQSRRSIDDYQDTTITITTAGTIEFEYKGGYDIDYIVNLNTGDDFSSLISESLLGTDTATITSPPPGAYRIEYHGILHTYVDYVIVGYTGFAIDTHSDAIRTDNGTGWLWNDLSALSSLMSSAGSVVGAEDELFLQALIMTYKEKLKVEILRIMVFGDQPIPSGEIVVRLREMPFWWWNEYQELTFNPLQDYNTIITYGGMIWNPISSQMVLNPLATVAMDRFLNFASIYLDHWGLSVGEADALAEYIMSEVIGDSLIAADDAKILPNGTTDAGTVTYNTNEAVFNGNTIVKYRELIEGYSPIDLRAGLEDGGYNDVFSKIKFAAVSTDYYPGLGDTPLAYNGKYDKSMPEFKNYRTTVYAVMHQIKQQERFMSRGILEYLDVGTYYINGPEMFGGEEEIDLETDEEGDWGFGEFDITPDPYITGRMQSIIIMPNTAFDLSYVGLGIMPTTKPLTYPQPQYSYLEPAQHNDEYMITGDVSVYPNLDKLKINTIFRYHQWDPLAGTMTVYECLAPVVNMFVTIDEWGISPGDIWDVEFDITTLQFLSPDGQLLDNNNFTVTLDQFAGPGMNGEGGYDLYTENIGFGRQSIGTEVFDDFFEESKYSTGTRPGYVSNYTGFSYFEIAFSAELNGRPYDFMYGLQIMITQICGNLV